MKRARIGLIASCAETARTARRHAHAAIERPPSTIPVYGGLHAQFRIQVAAAAFRDCGMRSISDKSLPVRSPSSATEIRLTMLTATM